MSSENDNSNGEPGDGPKILMGECAECGLPVERIGRGWIHAGPAEAKFDHFARPKAEVVETGHVGRPVFDPSPVRCPHCGHVGTPDQECSSDTCANCGMDVSEAPVVDPPNGKMSAAELGEIADANRPKVRRLDLHEYDAAGLLKPCECHKMAGWRNCPRHRHLSMPPASAPMGMTALATSGAPGTDMREVGPEEKIERGDVGNFAAGYSEVSEAMVGDEAKFYDPIRFYRGVGLGEPEGAMGEPGIGVPTEEPPVPLCRCHAVAEFRGRGWMRDAVFCAECLPSSMRVGKEVDRIGESRELDPPRIWTPTPDGTVCPGCGAPVVREACLCGVRGPTNRQIAARPLESCDVIEAGDLAENHSGAVDTVPSVWVGMRVGQTQVWRPVRNGESSPQPRTGPPSWFGEALLEARCKDLAGAGHRLAKCAECSGLLYETEGVFVHADGLMPSHVGVPVDIFDPAVAGQAVQDGAAFACTAPPRSLGRRLLDALFPPLELALPEAPADWVDVIHLDAVTHFSALDRFRLIVSGKLHTRAIIVCQNLVGQTKVVSGSLPLAPGRGRA